jgi:hypothetical protein
MKAGDKIELTKIEFVLEYGPIEAFQEGWEIVGGRLVGTTKEGATMNVGPTVPIMVKKA